MLRSKQPVGLMASLAFAVAADAATADGTDAFAADAFAGLGLAAYVAAYAAAYVAVPVERRDSAAATVSDVDGLAVEPGDVAAMLAALLVRAVVETAGFVSLPGSCAAESAAAHAVLAVLVVLGSVVLAVHAPVGLVEPAGTAGTDTVGTDAAAVAVPGTVTAELAVAVDTSAELAADKSAACAGMAMPAPVDVGTETTDAVGTEMLAPGSADTRSAVRIADTVVAAAAVALAGTGAEFAGVE